MMIGQSMIRNFAFALVALLLAGTLAPAKASAQDFWDSFFGPGGRQVVGFSKRFTPGTVIVSFGDRRLYYVAKRGMAISYPVAVPKGEARWSGVTHVSQKRVNPPWTPTADMRRENPRLPAFVPGGHPRNPLGNRALYLGDTLYRIHGTDAPWTIGTAVSHGCIRMYNNDVQDLYRRVRVGAKVIVTWRRFDA